jgi:hypothetical protein
MHDNAAIPSIMHAMGRVNQDLTRENQCCVPNIDPESPSLEVPCNQVTKRDQWWKKSHWLGKKWNTRLVGVLDVYSWKNPESQTYKRWISAFPHLQSLSSAMLFTKINLALVLFTLSTLACNNAGDCDNSLSNNYPGLPVTTCME